MFDLDQAKKVIEEDNNPAYYRADFDEYAFMTYATGHFREAVEEIERMSDQQARIRRVIAVHEEIIGGETGLLAVMIRRILDSERQL